MSDLHTSEKTRFEEVKLSLCSEKLLSIYGNFQRKHADFVHFITIVYQ